MRDLEPRGPLARELWGHLSEDDHDQLRLAAARGWVMDDPRNALVLVDLMDQYIERTLPRVTPFLLGLLLVIATGTAALSALDLDVGGFVSALVAGAIVGLIRLAEHQRARLRNARRARDAGLLG